MVVIPVFNVEAYVAECLDSILDQGVDGLEVVVVNDGSTDRTAAIVAAYVNRGVGITMLSQPNAGPSRARNVAVASTRGEYLTFVDADDLVRPGSYELMLATLDASGSDFAVGTVERNYARGVAQPADLKALHRRRRIGVTLHDFPEMLVDVFVWNKVFRRSSWSRMGLAFPEGLMYEDQPLLTRAFLSGATFDVLRKVVYFRRIRADGSSVTQQRHHVSNLADRFETRRLTRDMIDADGWPAVQDLWYREVMVTGLPLYLRQIPGCSDEFWHVLHAGLRDLWRDRLPLAESALPVPYRLVAWLAQHDMRPEAEQVVGFLAEHGDKPDIVIRDGYEVAELPFLDDTSGRIPRHLYRLPDRPTRGSASSVG